MMGTEPPSTDHAAPGHVRRPLGAQEADDGGDLLGLPRAAERDSARTRSSASSRVIPCAPAAWSAMPALLEPQAAADRARASTALTSTPRARVGVGERARERELGRLGHGVGGVGRRGALARGGGDVDDPRPSPARPCRGASALMRRIGAEHVQLPLLEPVRVGQLVQRRDRARAGVVDEDVGRGRGRGQRAPGRSIGDVGGHGLGRRRRSRPRRPPAARRAPDEDAGPRPPPPALWPSRGRCRRSRR